MIMFFDVETTGLPKNWKAPMSDLDNWPRIIQLAWSSTDISGQPLATGNFLIKPDGWEIPQQQFWIEHGFNTQRSTEQGIPMVDALKSFLLHLKSCMYVVSHNMDFDYNVTGAEMLRYGVKAEHRAVQICTKEASTRYCKIPFPGRKYRGSQSFKWPTLSELHRHLFNHDFQDAHDAGGDVAALKNCFFGLVKAGVIILKNNEAVIQPYGT